LEYPALKISTLIGMNGKWTSKSTNNFIISIWISQCEICGANKPPHKSSKAPLGSMPVGAPLDRLGTDLLGPLPVTPRGNKYILTITDYFTKWVEIFAVPEQFLFSFLFPKVSRYYGVMHIFKDFLSKPQRNYELIVAFHTIFSVEFLEQEFICDLQGIPLQEMQKEGSGHV
jgi:hypothetical protein